MEAERPSAGRVVVGRIVKAQGLRGEVIVAPTGDDPKRFAPGMTLFLGETGSESLRVCHQQGRDKGYVVRFEGREDRTSVEELVGRSLYLESESLPALPEGVYYHYQLIGLTVRRADGGILGKVTSVWETPGTDLFEVQGGGGTWLIPGRKEFVAWVDLDRGEMGLTDRDDLIQAQDTRDPSYGSPS